MNTSPSQVLQTQVSVLGRVQLQLTFHINGAPLAALVAFASCPTFRVHTPLYRRTERPPHHSPFTWGLQSVLPVARQATQRREAVWTGPGVSWRRRRQSPAGSNALCSGQLLPGGDIGLELPDLDTFKERVEI